MSVTATAPDVCPPHPASESWRASRLNRRRLVKGNEALALGAVAGGADCFFGYPNTPQNEIPEILSGLMPKLGRVFVRAEQKSRPSAGCRHACQLTEADVLFAFMTDAEAAMSRSRHFLQATL